MGCSLTGAEAWCLEMYSTPVLFWVTGWVLGVRKTWMKPPFAAAADRESRSSLNSNPGSDPETKISTHPGETDKLPASMVLSTTAEIFSAICWILPLWIRISRIVLLCGEFISLMRTCWTRIVIRNELVKIKCFFQEIM